MTAAGYGYVQINTGRHVPVLERFLIIGVNYSTASGAVWEGAVRLLPDAAGAVISALTITAVVQGDDTLVTVTMPAPATIPAVPQASYTGGLAVLYYDIHLTPSGGTEQVLVGGEFNVVAGVVQ